MKDSVRKKMLEMFQTQALEPEIQQLKETYERKGSLSKRELKILFGKMKADPQVEAA